MVHFAVFAHVVQIPRNHAENASRQGRNSPYLEGSDVMCPGLTSAGGELPDDETSSKLRAGDPVAIYCEGKHIRWRLVY